MSSCTRWLFVLLATANALCAASALAGSPAITSGFNQLATGPTINIPTITFGQSYQVSEALIFDPNAGPMTKNFAAPTNANGTLIGLIGSQPLPFPVNEDFSLTGRTIVTDWHERITTPGWIWVTPDKPITGFPFPEGTTLITRNGQAWPSTIIPQSDASRIDVLFPAINSGNVLDIHKQLLWVGTTDNPIWGDSPNETTITVIEYPTPEPSTIVLAIVGFVALLLARKRLR